MQFLLVNRVRCRRDRLMRNVLKKRGVDEVGLKWSKENLSDLERIHIPPDHSFCQRKGKSVAFLTVWFQRFLALFAILWQGLELSCSLKVLWNLGSVLVIKQSSGISSGCKKICVCNLHHRFSGHQCPRAPSVSTLLGKQCHCFLGSQRKDLQKTGTRGERFKGEMTQDRETAQEELGGKDSVIYVEDFCHLPLASRQGVPHSVQEVPQRDKIIPFQKLRISGNKLYTTVKCWKIQQAICTGMFPVKSR